MKFLKNRNVCDEKYKHYKILQALWSSLKSLNYDVTLLSKIFLARIYKKKAMENFVFPDELSP